MQKNYLECRKALSNHWRGLILNCDGELCVYTFVFTERKKEGESDQSFSYSTSFSDDEINTSPRNLSKLTFLFHFQIVFLHNDRYIEFHSQSGFYYKTRIPKFGRDFSYHYPSCDLYFVGARYWAWSPFVFSFPPPQAASVLNIEERN